MRILNETVLTIAWAQGQVNFPRHSLSLIVKATIDLRHGDTCSLAEEQSYPIGDVPLERDGCDGQNHYETDYAPFKPQGDFLVQARAYAPGGRATDRFPVSVSAGSCKRQLIIFGERHWKGGILGSSPTEPRPFTECDLDYRLAFGGESSPVNPCGIGAEKILSDSGQKLRPMPRIEDPNDLTVSPKSEPTPATLGPRPRLWAERAALTGTYDKRWEETRWPWVPEDFDWAHWNAAPPAQQIRGYFQGDESLYFENLHREHAEYTTQLPGVRPRLFVESDLDGRTDFAEVELNLDTVWVDLEAEKGTLVWRGIVDVESDEYSELSYLYLNAEMLDQARKPLAEYRAAYDRAREAEEEEWEDLPDPEEIPVEPPTPEELAAEQEALEQERKDEAEIAAMIAANPAKPMTAAEVAAMDLKLADLTKDNEEQEEADSDDEEMSRERVVEYLAEQRPLDGCDLSRLDLSQLDFSGASLRDTLCEETNFDEAKFAGSRLEGATLLKASLCRANLDGASLIGAELSQARLEGASLVSAQLGEANLEGANLTDANLTRVDGAEINLNGAVCLRARFTGANLYEGMLSEADISEADFSEADLTQLSLESAVGVNARFSRAIMTGARASEGADFTDADFCEIDARESIWEDANLLRAKFDRADLCGADFSGATLNDSSICCANAREAKFAKSELQRSQLVDSNFFSGTFEAADLTEADCSGANLYGVEFHESETRSTRFDRANLKMSKLAQQEGA